MKVCERCDDAPSVYIVHLMLIHEDLLEERKDSKELCAECSREIGFDNVVEPGICDTCGAVGPEEETRCPGCERDLSGI